MTSRARDHGGCVLKGREQGGLRHEILRGSVRCEHTDRIPRQGDEWSVVRADGPWQASDQNCRPGDWNPLSRNSGGVNGRSPRRVEHKQRHAQPAVPRLPTKQRGECQRRGGARRAVAMAAQRRPSNSPQDDRRLDQEQSKQVASMVFIAVQWWDLKRDVRHRRVGPGEARIVHVNPDHPVNVSNHCLERVIRFGPWCAQVQGSISCQIGNQRTSAEALRPYHG